MIKNSFLFLFLIFGVVGFSQNYSRLEKKINFSRDLKKSRTTKFVQEALLNPELIINLRINIYEDITEFELFKNNIDKFINLKKLVIYNPYFTKDISFKVDLTPLDNLECLKLIGLNCNENLRGLERLSKLKLLYIVAGRLTVLPKGILDLKKLKILDLGVNFLTTLPKEIINLKYLKELDIPDNCFKLVPNSIQYLNNLCDFNFNNAETKLHFIDGKVTCKNELLEVPDFIFKMPHLKKIGFYRVYMSKNVKKDIKHKKGKIKIKF